MKKNKIYLLSTIVMLLSSFAVVGKTYAASFNFDGNWNESTCTGTINGGTGILNYHMIAGDPLTVTFNNISSTDMNVVFAKTGGTGSFYRFVKAGASDTESFASVQDNISVTGSANATACQGNYTGAGPASASISADLKPASSGGNTTPTTTAPAATVPKSSTISTTTPATQTSTTANTPVIPDPPKITNVSVSGHKTDSTNLIINSNQALKLQGTTIPNGIVTLTIHSTPRTVKVTADNMGAWSYTVSDLGQGSHFIEASVTDPKTNQTAPTQKLLSFKINAPVAKTVTKKNNKATYLVGLLALLILGGAYFVAMNRKNNSRPEILAEDTSPLETTSESVEKPVEHI